MTPDGDALLTVAEVAARLRVSPCAVRRLAKAGRLRHCRPTLGGGRILFRAADVAAHLARCTFEGDMAADPVLRHISLDPRPRRGARSRA